MTLPVVARFAPSPTGYLHIGGARLALFNWLYARGRGGKMLLRIEDTDRERSTKAAIRAIIDGLTWLGISWDGEVVYQSARAARHRAIAEAMLASGQAYRCYATPDELDAMRKAARAEGKTRLYNGLWRDRDPSEAPPGAKFAIRLKAPLAGETVVEDQVQGRVHWQNESLDDVVLMHSDGTPTYMLAVVVDDHDMGVTHIIRDDDHLNAARQSQIYQALGWSVPVVAHIPPIRGPDGSKLSKRHGALGVDAYRAMGYLPAALRNYLVRLGWAHRDHEIFSTEEMIAAFDLARIARSPAGLDFAKLESLNSHYMRQSTDAELLAAIEETLPYTLDVPEAAVKLAPELRSKLATALAGMQRPGLREKFLIAMPGLKERAKTLIELVDAATFIFADRPLPLDDRATVLMTVEARALLATLVPVLEAVEPWSVRAIEQALRVCAEHQGAKLGGIAQPLRAALTGRTTSPSIFDVLTTLGKRESLARLRDQVHSEVVQR